MDQQNNANLPAFSNCIKHKNTKDFAFLDLNDKRFNQEVMYCSDCMLKMNQTTQHKCSFVYAPNIIKKHGHQNRQENTEENNETQTPPHYSSQHHQFQSNGRLNSQLPPLQNWPHLINQEDFDYLEENYLSNKRNEKKIEMSNFYKQLKAQINESIEKSELAQIKQLDNCKKIENGLIEFYNREFKRAELTEIFSNSQKFDQNKYRELLAEIEKKREENLLELHRQIVFYKSIENLIKNDQPKLINEIANSLISKINFFDKSLLEEQNIEEIQDQPVQEKLSQQIIENIKGHQQYNLDLDTIGKLITNDISKYDSITKQLEDNLSLLQSQIESNTNFITQYKEKFHEKQEKYTLDQIDSLQGLIQKTHQNILDFQLRYNDIENEQTKCQADSENKDGIQKIILSYLKLTAENQKQVTSQYPHLTQNCFSELLSLENKTKEQANQISTLEQDKNTKQNDINEKVAGLEQKAQEINQLNERITALENEKNQLNPQIEQLNSTIDQLKNEKQSILDNDVKQLQDKITVLENEKQQLQQAQENVVKVEQQVEVAQ